MNASMVVKIAAGTFISCVCLIFIFWITAIWAPSNNEQFFWTGCLFIPIGVVSIFVGAIADEER